MSRNINGNQVDRIKWNAKKHQDHTVTIKKQKKMTGRFFESERCLAYLQLGTYCGTTWTRRPDSGWWRHQTAWGWPTRSCSPAGGKRCPTFSFPNPLFLTCHLCKINSVLYNIYWLHQTGLGSPEGKDPIPHSDVRRISVPNLVESVLRRDQQHISVPAPTRRCSYARIYRINALLMIIEGS